MCNIMWKLSETRLAGAGLGRSGGGMADMNSSNLSASAEQELAQAAECGHRTGRTSLYFDIIKCK